MKVWITDPTDDTHFIEGEANIETKDLIAELEKRRPCEKCKYIHSSMCSFCIWRGESKDNFKEDKGGKQC